jgi:hypothetical protein
MKQIILLLIYLFVLSKNSYSQSTNCIESNRWKFEDYTQKPFFANQIFTKGYGIYVLFHSKKEPDKFIKDSIENSILNGFRVALTNWGVSLLINKDSLSPEIKKYLDDYSFKNGNNSTYNAPMVFKVDCIENANFVIQVYFEKGKKFKDDKSVLAKAQIKGRTIIMNMQTHIIRYEQRLFDVYLPNNGFNIVPILAHELGHCFGLTHDTSGLSIMAITTKNIARFPTQRDGLNFAKILALKLKGTNAGYFNPTECVGLKVE